MVTGRDIDTSADRVRTPNPAPRQSNTPITPDWRGGDDFSAFLRAAEPRERQQVKSQPKAAKREEKEREGEGLSALFGPAPAQAQAAKSESGDTGAIAGFAPTAQGGAQAEIAIPVPTAGGTAGDVSALMATMDRAWSAAAGDKGKALNVFIEQASVVGLGVKRGADGSLSLILAARPDATPEVTKSLEALRRRLEARGLSLSELRLALGAEGLDPKVPGTME